MESQLVAYGIRQRRYGINAKRCMESTRGVVKGAPNFVSANIVRWILAFGEAFATAFRLRADFGFMANERTRVLTESKPDRIHFTPKHKKRHP